MLWDVRHYIKLKQEQADMFSSLYSHAILYKQYIWKFASEHFAFSSGEMWKKIFCVEIKAC